MPRYSEERKVSVLKKLLPPHNRPVPEVAREEGISEVTLYNWRKQAKAGGAVVPGSVQSTTDGWSAETKFATVVETAALNEHQLSEYCRSKGLYPEQIARWRKACIEGAGHMVVRDRETQRQERQDRKQIKQLKRELQRKEKALAEAAALLVLRKKLQALWEGGEEE